MYKSPGPITTKSLFTIDEKASGVHLVEGSCQIFFIDRSGFLSSAKSILLSPLIISPSSKHAHKVVKVSVTGNTKTNFLQAVSASIGKLNVGTLAYELVSVSALTANTLTIDKTVLLPKGYPKTKEMIETAGFDVITLDMSEFAKCEGALTCLSILF